MSSPFSLYDGSGDTHQPPDKHLYIKRLEKNASCHKCKTITNLKVAQ